MTDPRETTDELKDVAGGKKSPGIDAGGKGDRQKDPGTGDGGSGDRKKITPDLSAGGKQGTGDSADRGDLVDKFGKDQGGRIRPTA